MATRFSLKTAKAENLTQAQAERIMELAADYLATQIKDADVISSPEATRQFLQLRLADSPFEIFSVLWLDNRHRVIAFEELFNGTIDGASVHPREVVRRALHHNAAAAIFSHNHPSGVCEPSQSDLHITARLKEAIALIDVRVLDHVIVSPEGTTSLAEKGLI